MAGGNFAGFSKSIDVDRVEEDFGVGAGFSAGLFLKTPTFRNFRLKGVGHYALHTGGVPNLVYSLRNQYLAGSAMLEYRIVDDFWIHAGVNYLHLISSRLFGSRTQLQNAGNARGNSFGFQNEINPLFGFELRMTENAYMDVNYIHPVSDLHSRNFQVSIYLNIVPIINEPSQKQLAHEVAYNQISELKNGVLLVRLSTSTAQINALKSRGRTEEADKIGAKQRQVNREIVDAFRSKFDFCRVEFFYSFNSQKVREGNLKGVFLDEKLNTDSTITVDPRSAIYTAEFGTTGESSTGGINFAALVIMDRKMETLQKPFPYYTRALHSATEQRVDKVFLALPLMLFSPMTYWRTVEKQNTALHYFYSKNRKF